MTLKKTAALLMVCLMTTTIVFAQGAKTQAYIAKYNEIAIKEMIRTGVPAAITLAQGVLESGNGESMLATESNNHFGIKCKKEWTGDKTYKDDDEKGECFRVYPSAEASFADHSDFLKSRPWYGFLFNLEPTDFEGWAKGLKKAGYATETKYPQMLMKIIQDNNLQQYTLLAMQRSKDPNYDVATVNIEAAKPEENPFTGIIVKEENGKTVIVEPKEEASFATLKSIQVPDEVIEGINPPIEAPAYPEGTFVINDCKVIYAAAGTSLLALANNYNLAYKRLLDFNDLEDKKDILDQPQLIFLQKKQKKGTVEFYTAKKNESIYEIAQQQGVQLNMVQEYNRLEKNAIAKAGDKIYLKPFVTTAPSQTKKTK